MSIQERFFCGGYEFDSAAKAVMHGDLMKEEVFMEVVRSDRDVVLGHNGIHKYVDGGWDWIGFKEGPRPKASDSENNEEPPVCGAHCRYRQVFSGLELQRNALRSELASMIATDRCGWNVKPGHIGGAPLDYEPCTFSGA